MISPSPAMNTSSPLERKIFLGSPGLLAKPKNFKGIGGGAATDGGWYPGFVLLSVVPLSCGVGITGSACDTKMFLPEPSYLICSVEASCSRCSVGSRLCGGRSFFAEPEPELCRAVARAAFREIPSGPFAGVAGVVEAIVDEEGMNWYTTTN